MYPTSVARPNQFSQQGFYMPMADGRQQLIPSFRASDIQYGGDRMLDMGGGDGGGMGTQRMLGNTTLNNVGSYFPGWENLNPSNFVFSQANQDGTAFDPNRLSLMVKSDGTTGSQIDFSRQGDYWVPNADSLRTQQWDTNSANRFRNVGLGLVAGGAAGASLLGPGAAGASAAPGSGLTMTGAFNSIPIAEGAGLAGGAGAAGSAAPAAGGLSSLLPSSASGWAQAGMGLLGAIGGASGSGPQTTTSSTSLPPWLNALGPEFANRAREAANTPNPGLEGFNADQQNAFQAVRNQANSPLTGDASNLLSRTMRGDFLNSNPYLDNMVRQTTDDLQGRFNTTALGSGSFGNANATQQGMQGIANAANNLRFQGYEAERGRQMQAAGLAPSINNMGLTNANAFLGIGDQQQQFGQMQREQPFNWQLRQMDALSRPFGFNQGQTTTQTQPGTNRWASALGGALTAAQIWSLFGK